VFTSKLKRRAPCILSEGRPAHPPQPCTFCSRIARTTSAAVKLCEANLFGLSHTRMLKSPAPKICTLPTPGNGGPNSSFHLENGQIRQVQHCRNGCPGTPGAQTISKSGEVFFRRYAEALDFLRQSRQRLRYAVLHLHLRFVEVRAQSEVIVRVITPSAVACENM